MLYSPYAPGLNYWESGSRRERRAGVARGRSERTSVVIVPVGPYQSALPDPLALRLRARGERIVEVAGQTSITTGFGRRALLDQLQGVTAPDALVTLERICPQAGQAYRLAFSLAVERALRVKSSRAANLARIAFAELELLLAAHTQLTRMAGAFGLRPLATRGLEQRETLFALAHEATGQRVYWGIARPGGVRPQLRLAPLRGALTWLAHVADAWEVAAQPRGALGRAARAIGPDLPKPARAPGVLAGSEASQSGAASRDPRRDAPYSGYRAITVDWALLDALPEAPTFVAAQPLRLTRQMRLSADIVRACVECLGDTPDLTPAPVAHAAGEGAAIVQSAHGPARVAVTLAPGDSSAGSEVVVTSLRLTLTCADALVSAPRRLEGLRLDQTSAMLASLGLCPSCVDL